MDINDSWIMGGDMKNDELMRKSYNAITNTVDEVLGEYLTEDELIEIYAKVTTLTSDAIMQKQERENSER